MENSRNPVWYREEAARLRALAEATKDSAELRDSYLALSVEYERLAVVLEQIGVLAREGLRIEKIG